MPWAHRRPSVPATTAAVCAVLTLGVPAAAGESHGGSAGAAGAPSGTAPGAVPRALTPAQSACVSALNKQLLTSQRVGQLLWVGLDASAAPSGADALVRKYALGGVVLLGGYHDGVAATRVTTDHVKALADPRVRMVVAADQEGGYVQQLQGSGISTMPTAYYQGRNYSQATLLAQTSKWGRQIADAGVNVNLAPVADTVSKAFMPYNKPIGYYQRNYDYVADRVATDVTTVIAGMHAGGVGATAKHFPGLGRVTGNTDTTTVGITDDTTTTTSGYLRPFQAAVSNGADFVMVSSAWYPKIDGSSQAVFSRIILTHVLRLQLGYTDGVILSDDLGAAAAVQAVPVGQRATSFIWAGGDIVLTATPASVAPMIAAIRQYRSESPTFKARLDAAVLRILTTKTRLGLTSCS